MSQAVVLCGGLGTRMRAMHGDVPKILIEVAGAPFLHHLLARLEACAFERVLLCTGHGSELVAEAVRRAPRRAMSIDLASDGGRLLGTAGALRAALPQLEPCFLVTYGDAYLPFDYAAPLRLLQGAAPAEAAGCMAVYENHDRLEPSNAAVRDRLVVRYDKARGPGEPALDHLDYGAMALARSLIEALPPDQPIGLDTIQARLAAAGRLLACPASERPYEIGSPAGLVELRAYLAART